MLTVEENIVLPLTLDGLPLEEMERRVAGTGQDRLDLICNFK